MFQHCLRSPPNTIWSILTLLLLVGTLSTRGKKPEVVANKYKSIRRGKTIIHRIFAEDYRCLQCGDFWFFRLGQEAGCLGKGKSFRGSAAGTSMVRRTLWSLGGNAMLRF
ncbi:hypothetical protein BC936DRAFT_148186, partial [Jimgerdemannia flammicorona]